MAVFISNAHNLSQTYRLKSVVRQLGRWAKGSGIDPLPVRGWRWLGHRPRMSLARKLRHWWLNREGSASRPVLRDNLAVGFFGSVAPADPTAGADAFVVHASEDWDNGELRVCAAGRLMQAVQSLQNLPIYYIVVLRERGAVFYASSAPGARGLGAYPSMRPIAIDPWGEDQEVYAGLWQAVVGEIGFTKDTRVHGAAVSEIPALAGPFGGAHAAASFSGGPAGPGWHGHGERPEIGPEGCVACGEGALLFDPAQPTGLLHALVRPPRGGDGRIGVAWRARGPDEHWMLTVGAADCALQHRQEQRVETIARSPLPGPRTERGAAVQVLDDGREIRCFIDGAMAWPPILAPDLGGAGRSVGVVASGRGGLLRDFEAHPRAIPIPASLDLGAPWVARGERVLVRDEFDGPRADLAGRRTTVGGKAWRRDVGVGAFETTGARSARVVASREAPAPGRTVYTVEWENPSFADLDLEMTPPGTRRFEGHGGRSGVVFWQDPRNHILINLWLYDGLGTASISTFFYINGFEDLYDAVWTCTGQRRMTWGVPFRLRAVCDGNDYLVWVNGEPVLHRRLTDVYPHLAPLRLNRVGLQTNWEWGTDTGTVFRDFVARG